MRKTKYMTKHQVAKSKNVKGYLHGFDDEHVYLILEGEQYCHPNSLSGGDKNVLPEEFWDELDKIAVELAKRYITKC